MRWKITLEYDGTDFAGWQFQPGQRTLQGTIEEALTRLCDHPVTVSVSGRTDAGVHALAQVASFQTSARRDERAIRAGLNAFLPLDFACVRAEPVEDAFDARYWSWGKHYRYTWLVRDSRSPLIRTRAWHLRGLDAAPMAEAVGAIVGRHDFTSFRAQGCAASHPNRTIEAATVTADGDLVHLDVHGQGFLRHMVRIIAGTLAEVGSGKRPSTFVADALAARDRTAAGQTAPPNGLTLIEAKFGDGPPPWIDPDPEPAE